MLYHICFRKGSLSAEGQRPHTPLKAAGILILPAMSFPIPTGDILAAMAAPSPPELPPGDFLGFQGFRALPQRKLLQSKLKASWGKLVLMKGMRPVNFMHLMVAQSSLTNLSARIVTPRVDLVFSMSMFSLMEVGIPKRGGK